MAGKPVYSTDVGTPWQGVPLDNRKKRNTDSKNTKTKKRK